MIAPQPFYTPRGTPMNVLQMCRVLTRAGYRVDLATYPMGEDISTPRLEIHRCLRIPFVQTVPIGFSARKVLLDLFLSLTILRLYLTRRYAIVHAIEESVFLAMPLTWLGTGLIYDLDSLISDQLLYTGVLSEGILLRTVRSAERLALRRSRAAIAVCQSLANEASTIRPELPIYQIEDAPLPETLREPSRDKVGALQSELGLAGCPVVVYTGNLESYQGIDFLLDGVAELHQRLPEVRVVLVGGEPTQVVSCEQRILSMGLAGVVILAGKRPTAEMPEWMQLADVLVSPRSQGENTPLKIYSYMLSGTPIVATDLPTHTQVLDRSTAFLCEPTPTSLAAEIGRAISDIDLAQQVAKRAQRLAREDFSLDAFESKLLRAYAEILHGSESPTPSGKADLHDNSAVDDSEGREL